MYSLNVRDHFSILLKTFLLSEYWCTQCVRGTCDDALYKLMFYLLTYLLTLPSFSHDQHHKTDAAKWKGGGAVTHKRLYNAQ